MYPPRRAAVSGTFRAKRERDRSLRLARIRVNLSSGAMTPGRV